MFGSSGRSVDLGFRTEMRQPANKFVNPPRGRCILATCMIGRSPTRTWYCWHERARSTRSACCWNATRVPLYAAALAILGDRHAAMDAVQETFVVVLTRLESLRDPGAVGGWLQAVLRNCCLLQLRPGRHEVPSD
jgi:hypothetical protein